MAVVKKLIALLTLVCLVAVTAGCGGEPTKATTKAPDKPTGGAPAGGGDKPK